jgi:NTE family protein
MGNPALFPFHGKTGTDDIVVIQINPIVRKGAPKTPQDIQNRMNEISFNGSLLKELRGIDFVDRLIREGKLSTDDYRQVRVHIVENEDEMNSLGASSKMNVEWDFLTMLRDMGRDTAARWLNETYESIGERGTVDLQAMFQGIGAEHQG